MRVLLTEDDDLLGLAMQKSLDRAGHTVDWLMGGKESLLSLSTCQYDLLILDLGLPDVDGELVLHHARAVRANMPVIVVTARVDIDDRIRILDLGADDYITKPFDLDELKARIRSVTRRIVPEDDDGSARFSHGPLRLLPQRASATLNGLPVSLSRREFSLLEALMRRKNQVLSKAQLEEALYAWGEEIDSNAIEVYVHFLRRKLGAQLIETVRGVGYQMAPLRPSA